jgi:glycosyltransferase involved in cell wall biosynthesis
MKLAIIADSLPPAGTGEAMLIYRLLADVDPSSYCLVSTVPPSANNNGAYVRSLAGNYYDLPTSGRQLTRGYRFGLAAARERMNLGLMIWHRAKLIREILRKEKCDVACAFTGDVTHLPAAFIACRREKIPFVAYVVDHYSYREFYNPAAAFVAQKLEPLLMKRAGKVIVLNEALRDDLQRRFNVKSTIIYNSFDLAPYRGKIENIGPPNGEVSIVFTGNVYDAHYDAFRNLLAAIRIAGRENLRLHLYTPQTAEELAQQGISGPITFHQPLASDEMPRVQRKADILFLPLAFNSPYPGVVRTSAPTKMGEYLAARRPILVHAPSDAYVTWYFRQHDCGVVVDRLDPPLLAEAIKRILGNDEYVSELLERAWERAVSDFDLNRARRRFMSVLTQQIQEMAQ